MNYHGRPDSGDLKPSGAFTHLEYLEMSHEEMKKFKHLQPIRQADINNVNWEQLSQQLLTA